MSHALESWESGRGCQKDKLLVKNTCSPWFWFVFKGKRDHSEDPVPRYAGPEPCLAFGQSSRIACAFLLIVAASPAVRPTPQTERKGHVVSSYVESEILGPPWWLCGKESACQCRGHRFDAWSRKIPLPRAGEHQSLRMRATVWSLCPRACRSQH